MSWWLGGVITEQHPLELRQDGHPALAQLEAMAGAKITRSTSLKLSNLIRAAQRYQRTGAGTKRSDH